MYSKIRTSYESTSRPRSTNDTLVDDKDLVGGASAMARAARKNLAAAERVTSTGNMLSGKVLNQVGLFVNFQ